MKLVLIVYNVAIEEEVMESLKEIGVENYTKWDRVLGKGKTSGTHLDTDVWPGVNHMLAIAVEDEKKDKIMARVRELKSKEVLRREGIGVFVLPLEEMI
ncbi:MAG TPA: transcriptional regulator [bacterium]|nr:transcriptional regulator [bacterium]